MAAVFTAVVPLPSSVLLIQVRLLGSFFFFFTVAVNRIDLVQWPGNNQVD